MDTKAELLSHIRDLARRSADRGIYTFSDFLSPAELSDVLGIEQEIIYAGIKIAGRPEERNQADDRGMNSDQLLDYYDGTAGNDENVARHAKKNAPGSAAERRREDTAQNGAERVMIRLGNHSYEQDFPIECLEVEPLMKKFADELSHRDFLGALMNLGIERGLLGDIIVRDKSAYIFCQEKISDFIISELTRVKHTTVKVTRTDTIPEAAMPRLEEVEIIVSSPRADGVISKLFNLSRSESNELFDSEKVFINGRVAHSNSAELKPGDVVSARGFGKFIYDGEVHETKKGRVRVAVRRYV